MGVKIGLSVGHQQLGGAGCHIEQGKGTVGRGRGYFISVVIRDGNVDLFVGCNPVFASFNASTFGVTVQVGLFRSDVAPPIWSAIGV